MTTTMNVTLPLHAFAQAIVHVATDELIDAQGPELLIEVWERVPDQQGLMNKYHSPLYTMMDVIFQAYGPGSATWLALREAMLEAWDEYMDEGIDWTAPPC